MKSNALPVASDRNAISNASSPYDQARQYAVLASIADAVYCVDNAGRFTFVNAAFEAMTGYALVDLRGAPSSGLYVPEAEERFIERRCQARSGAAVSPYLETVLLLKDGRRLPVELSVSSLIIAGKVAGRVAILRDITARRQTEAVLQQHSERLALLSEAATELLATDGPLAFLDRLYDRLATLLDLEVYVHFALVPDGTYMELAASRGFTPAQCDTLRRLELGQAVCGTVAQTCQPMIVADVQNSSDPLTEVIRSLGITAYVCHPLLAGGKLFGTLSFGTKTRPQFTEESVNLIRAISDLVAIAIARKQADAALQQANAKLEQRVAGRTAELQQAHDDLRREMAERQRMQETLFQQEKLAALGMLLSNVAHELNNPLAVATWQLDNLQEEAGSGVWTEDIALLRQAVERCQSVVQSFLALARQQTPARHAVGLNAVIGDVLILLEHALKVDDITIESHLPDDLPPLWADANQLHHVVANLVTNAHHALQESAPPRHLILRTAAHADHSQVILEVADNGPGIPDDLQRRIFEPFFTTKPHGAGSGLGLPLCRNIVEGHGGTMHVASQPGHGTTVRVTLPVAVSGTPSSQAPPEPDGSARAQGGAILLIDDEPGVRKALTRVLQRGGHEVTTANDGREGLAALEAHSYEVILCDLHMPELDGTELYRELEHRHPHLLSRVIFLTGDTLSSKAQVFFAQVDRPRLIKPFKTRELRQVIQQMLEAR